MAKIARPCLTIIGSGAIGDALATAVHRKLYNVGAIITKHRRSSDRLLSGLHSVYHGTDLSRLPAGTRVIIIAVADDEIGRVVDKMVSISGFHWRDVVVLHTSGALSSGIFAPLKKLGAACGSLHPLQSFPRPLAVNDRKKLFFDIWWGIEGDRKALRETKRIVSFFRGRTIILKPEEKVLYHAACVVVSNYIVTLVSVAREIAGKAGVDGKIFIKAAEPLILTSIRNAMKVSPEKALTGPIERGDEKTIRRHIEEIRRLVPQFLDTYAALGSETVALALKKGTLKKEIAANLYRLLYTS